MVFRSYLTDSAEKFIHKIENLKYWHCSPIHFLMSIHICEFTEFQKFTQDLIGHLKMLRSSLYEIWTIIFASDLDIKYWIFSFQILNYFIKNVLNQIFLYCILLNQCEISLNIFIRKELWQCQCFRNFFAHLPILMKIKSYINQLIIVVFYYMISIRIKYDFLFSTLLHQIYNNNWLIQF